MRKAMKIHGISKKILLFAVAAVLLISLTGCSGYTSSYKAVAFVHSNEPSSAFMSFYNFDGRMVFKMKSAEGGQLNYSAKLESGSATVYYDSNGTKTFLFSIAGGEETDPGSIAVGAGTVYVLVETDGECGNGDFRFDLQ